MSEQSKWTVGSAIGLGVLLLALFANFNALFDDFNARLDDQSAQIAGLHTEIAGLRADVTGEIADLRAEVRADMGRLDDRLRAVEIAFVKVDQRLLTLERVLIPAADPGEDNLKASFAAEIAAVASVGGVERNGDALTFVETREDGAEVRWLVVIDSAAIAEPAAEGAPIQGRVVSSWYADGESIEPLGSMSRLPAAFLDAGIAQDCYALWDAETGRWGW